MEKKVIKDEKSKKNPNEMNALSLAYIGDAIYEVYIREYVLLKGNYKTNILHKRAIAYVSAKAQAKVVKNLIPELSEEEVQIVKRGRNTKTYTTPKNTRMIDYRFSTGFEALIGYLYLLKNNKRIEELIERSIDIIEGD